MLITSAAYFRVCEDCLNHGCIVLAGGTSRLEVASKEEALLDLEKCKTEVAITKEELPELQRQIMASPLARFKKDADPRGIFCAGLINLLDEAVEQVAQERQQRFPQGVYLPNVKGTA